MSESDKRREHRHRVLKTAMIIFPGHTSDFDCVVRDLTDEGACLMVPTPLGIPEVFELAIKGEAAMRPCHVAWRKADRIGVIFQ